MKKNRGGRKSLGLYFLLAFVFLAWTLVSLFSLFKQESFAALSLPTDSFLPVVNSPSTTGIQWSSREIPWQFAFGKAVTVNQGDQEFLYTIGGGQSANLRTNLVFRTQISKDGSPESITPQSSTNLLSLNGHTAVAANELIYVIGGTIDPPGDDKFEFSDVVSCNDVDASGAVTGKWERSYLIGMGEQKAGVGYHASVMLDNRIYILGGMRENVFGYFEYSKHVYSASPGYHCAESLNWRKEVEELPRGIINHAAVTVEIDGKEYIYILGGRYLSEGVAYTSEKIYRGSIENGRLTWTTLDCAPLPPMQLTTALQSGEFLYVIGGTSTASGSFISNSTVFRSRLETADLCEWETMNSLAMPSYGHAAATSSLGHIYLLGGISNTGSSKQTMNTIRWTPLVFFDKESSPPGAVLPGDQIRYEFSLISNNVRDLSGLIISDTLPSNVTLLDAPNFSQAGRLLTSLPFSLPINDMAWQSFTVEVNFPETPAPNGTPAAVTVKEIDLQVAPPQTSASIASSIRPTAVPGCVTADSGIQSGTPRPQPTCTPTPAVTVTTTTTVTPTITLTPTPGSVVVVNKAMLCIEGWCGLSDTAVNTPYRTYLPVIAR